MNKEGIQFIREHFNKLTDAQIADKLGVKAEAVRWQRRTLGLGKHPQKSSSTNEEHVTPAANDNIKKIEQLLEKSGIPLDEIRRVDKVRVGTYQMLTKDNDGEAQIHDLEVASLVLTPQWADGPEWPVVTQAAPTTVKPVDVVKKPDTGFKTAVVFPDPQIGYRFYMDTLEFDPFHDEQAMNVALQIARDLNPDVIVNLGDFLDLAAHGRFDQEPAFAQTTQAALDRGHKFLAEQRAICPEGDIVLIEGNHDRRLPKSIMNNAAASFGLKRANAPEKWPVLSVPYLLRLDELGVKYVDGYPAGQYYLSDRLKFKHGEKTGKRGTIAGAVVDIEKVSTIHGHNHHIEMVYKSVDTNHGQRTSLAATLGCLCRVDGAVPSTKGSTDSSGRPVKRFEDWQQAIGVITYAPNDGPFALEVVYINSGFALFRGKAYYAEQI